MRSTGAAPCNTNLGILCVNDDTPVVVTPFVQVALLIASLIVHAVFCFCKERWIACQKNGVAGIGLQRTVYGWLKA